MPSVSLPAGSEAVLETGHRDVVAAVLVDGETVYSGGWDGQLLARGAGGHYRRPPVLTYEIYALAWSPERQAILVGTEGGLFELAVASGTFERLEQPAQEIAVRALAAVGGCGFAGDDEGVVWKWENGGCRAFARLEHGVDELVAAPELGALLVNDRAGELHLLHASSGAVLWRIEGYAAGELRAGAVSGRRFLVGGVAQDGISGVVRAGDLASGSFDTEVEVDYAITAACAAPGGRFVTAHTDGTLRTLGPDLVAENTRRTSHSAGIEQVVTTELGLVTAGADGAVELVDRGAVLPSIPGRVVAAGLDVAMARAVTSDLTSVAIWDLEACEVLTRFGFAGALAVAFTEDGEVVLSDPQGIVQIRDPVDFELRREGRFTIAPRVLGTFAGQVLALCAENTLEVLLTSTFERVEPFDLALVPLFRRLRMEGPYFATEGHDADLRLLFVEGESVAVVRAASVAYSDAIAELVTSWDGSSLRPV